MSLDKKQYDNKDFILQKDIKMRDKYFKPHICSLTKTDSKYRIGCGRYRRCYFDLVSVNFNDIRAREMFKSYSSLYAERYRQFTKYPLAIHPFSKLRFWLEVICSSCILLCNTVFPIWIGSTRPHKNDLFHQLNLLFQWLFVVTHTIICALSGYVDGKNDQYIVLDKWKILKHYACTWLFIDMFELITAAYDVKPIRSQSHFMRMTSAILAFELIVLYTFEQNICKALMFGMITRTAVDVIFFLFAYLSWSTSIQFSIEYFYEDTFRPKSPRNCSWLTIGELWHAPSSIRRTYSVVRAVEMLRKNANYNLLEQDGCFELFAIFSFMVGQLLVLHCAYKYMLALFGSQSAKAKYYMMSQQIETYMNQRRFPPRIKEKILKFYAIRFRSHFFVESTMLECVSGQLREDIIMHTGRQLVREVTFLKDLPWAVLIQISLKFKLAIFIEGDVIYKVNSLGDRMFFISKGTVALYTASGCELFHLEDGDHFGEISFLSDLKYRFCTAVAVTNCELFTLSAEDFKIIERYRTAYEELRKTSLSRRQWAIMVDNQYRALLKERRETKWHASNTRLGFN